MDYSTEAIVVFMSIINQITYLLILHWSVNIHMLKNYVNKDMINESMVRSNAKILEML